MVKWGKTCHTVQVEGKIWQDFLNGVIAVTSVQIGGKMWQKNLVGYLMSQLYKYEVKCEIYSFFYRRYAYLVSTTARSRD